MRLARRRAGQGRAEMQTIHPPMADMQTEKIGTRDIPGPEEGIQRVQSSGGGCRPRTPGNRIPERPEWLSQ